MRNKIKENVPIISLYVLYSMIWFVLHLSCVRYGDDQLWLERAKTIHSIGDLMSNYREHISTWSSRVVIDFFGRLVELSPMLLWRTLDTAAFVFLTFQLDKLFNEKKNIRFTLLVMSICCIYPFVHLSSAGWMASTFTYLWPLALLLYAVRIWKELCEGEKIRPWQYVLSVLAYIYAIDQQQVAVSAVLLCIMVIVIQRKKIHPFLVAMSVLTVIRVIVHLKWPGSESRMISSIFTTFPDYKTMTLLDKLQIGASTTFHKIFFDGDMVFLLAGVLLMILVFQKYNDYIHRSIIFIPNVLFFLWGPLRNIFSSYFVGIYTLNQGYSATYGSIHNGNFFSEKSYLAFFVGGAATICILVSILAVFEGEKKAIVYSAIFITGLCSRIMMGFSPTVYVSGSRTYLFLYFAFLILMIAFAKRIIDENIKSGKWMLAVLYLWGAVSLLNTAIMIPWVK